MRCVKEIDIKEGRLKPDNEFGLKELETRKSDVTASQNQFASSRTSASDNAGQTAESHPPISTKPQVSIPIAPIPTPAALPSTKTPSKEPETKVAEKTLTQKPDKIELPVLNVGDSWRFRDEYGKELKYKVARVESKSYVIEGPDEGELYAYDKSTMDIKGQIDNEGRAIQVSRPPELYIDYPLYIGKKWKQTYTLLPIHSKRTGTGSDSTILREYKCVSLEDVKVKAGTFKAAKIKYKSTNVTGGASGDGWLWYSPEVKRIIKAVFHGSYFTRLVSNYELVSFNLRDKQPPLPEVKSQSPKVDTSSKLQSSQLENTETNIPATPLPVTPPPPVPHEKVDILPQVQPARVEKQQIAPSVAPSPASAPPPPNAGFVIVTGTTANIRAGAGNEFPIVTTVNQGAKLTLLGEYGKWFNVRLENGQEGWINSRFVQE